MSLTFPLIMRAIGGSCLVTTNATPLVGRTYKGQISVETRGTFSFLLSGSEVKLNLATTERNIKLFSSTLVFHGIVFFDCSARRENIHTALALMARKQYKIEINTFQLKLLPVRIDERWLYSKASLQAALELFYRKVAYKSVKVVPQVKRLQLSDLVKLSRIFKCMINTFLSYKQRPS